MFLLLQKYWVKASGRCSVRAPWRWWCDVKLGQMLPTVWSSTESGYLPNRHHWSWFCEHPWLHPTILGGYSDRFESLRVFCNPATSPAGWRISQIVTHHNHQHIHTRVAAWGASAAIHSTWTVIHSSCSCPVSSGRSASISSWSCSLLTMLPCCLSFYSWGTTFGQEGWVVQKWLVTCSSSSFVEVAQCSRNVRVMLAQCSRNDVMTFKLFGARFRCRAFT